MTGTIDVTASFLLAGTSDLETVQSTLAKRIQETYADGTGENQANQMWTDRRTLAATSETLDLAGSLTNALGATVTFAKIKAILIQVVTATAGYTLLVGGAAANQFLGIVADATDKLRIGAGGTLLLTAPVDGFTVTAGTGDQLKIDSGANSVTYDIILIGNT